MLRSPAMAHTAHRASRPGVVVLVTFALVVILAAACGSSVASPSPSPVPTPVVTPNPHLADPATAQDVFNALGREGLKITPNNAVAGVDGAAIVTRVNATYLGWPLDVTQFRTSADLAKAAKWKNGEAPGRGEPPVALAGYNILVTWGPWGTGKKPAVPDEQKAAALEALVAALDRLISPLRTRTIVPVEVAAAPSSTVPKASATPKATPAP
jgi:hypothetical protein